MRVDWAWVQGCKVPCFNSSHILFFCSGLGTSERHFSNVSLDVLPVKGPPLCVSEPVLKRTESSADSTWSVQPEQLVLTAPTISECTHPLQLSHTLYYWIWNKIWLGVCMEYNSDVCAHQVMCNVTACNLTCFQDCIPKYHVDICIWCFLYLVCNQSPPKVLEWVFWAVHWRHLCTRFLVSSLVMPCHL